MTIAESVFDGLTTAVENGGAICSDSVVDNSIGITNCSFRNNAATGLKDGLGYVLCPCLDKNIELNAYIVFSASFCLFHSHPCSVSC